MGNGEGSGKGRTRERPGQRKAVIQGRDDDGLRNSCGDGSEVVGYQIYIEGRAERIC